MRLVCSVPVIVALAGACASDDPPAEAPVRVQPDPQPEEPAAVASPTPAPAAAEPDEPPAPPAAAAPEETEVPADARIVMERTRCYGECPAYMVQLTADGTVEWDGRAHVRKKGKATGSISPDAFAELWRALAAVSLSDLPKSDADLGTPLCPDVFSNHTIVRVTLESAGEQRRAFDHRGCSGNPALDAFRELETRIDEVAGTSQWIRR